MIRFAATVRRRIYILKRVGCAVSAPADLDFPVNLI
ncbi:hypothetical protein [Citrobacter phage Tr1]|nr:hypothetical protein [Citrobacter phage Tr1]